MLEGLGLFLGELAGLDELVHERLIARDLHERARRAGCSARLSPTCARKSCSSTSAAAVSVVPMPRRVRSTLGASPKMRQARALDRARRAAAASAVALDAGAHAVDHALVDDVDRELARDLARRRAAHAVAHDHERALRAERVAASIGLRRLALAA